MTPGRPPRHGGTILTVPMYLDRHENLTISPEELAAAHQADLAEQGELGVQYHTYWFDQDRGTVFCLAEGPSGV